MAEIMKANTAIANRVIIKQGLFDNRSREIIQEFRKAFDDYCKAIPLESTRNYKKGKLMTTKGSLVTGKMLYYVDNNNNKGYFTKSSEMTNNRLSIKKIMVTPSTLASVYSEDGAKWYAALTDRAGQLVVSFE